jgi:hypothetical protein
MQTNDTLFTFSRMIKIIPYLTIAVLFMILFEKCKENKTHIANIEALNSTVATYKLENGQSVATIQSLQLDKAMAVYLILSKDAELTEMYGKFHDVKTITKYVTKTKIDTLKITYNDSIPCVFNRSGTVFEKWYNLGYKSNQHGIEIEELSIPDSVKIITGTKRKWLFGKKTQTIDIMHSNPFVQTEALQHIEIKQNNAWYNSTVAKIGLGFLGGYFITK